MNEPIGVIVLAAGQGTRFRQVAGSDRDKLLADCAGRDGAVRSVIEQVLVSVPAGLAKRVLVTTEDRPQVIRMAQAYGFEIVLVESTGMGDSIAAGVAACPQLAGWLITLGDMPFILPATVEQVVAGLATGFDEVRRGAGLTAAPDGRAQVVEIFTSASGSWTIVVTRPDGQTCLVASGQAWEDITEELPAKGEPA